jgi:hypothetical protein
MPFDLPFHVVVKKPNVSTSTIPYLTTLLTPTQPSPPANPPLVDSPCESGRLYIEEEEDDDEMEKVRQPN